MRTKVVKPKVADEVRIPENLAQFLGEVHRLIAEGDESVTASSDDLLQTEFAYGGLLEDDEDLFGFTYFPEGGTKPKWEIELSASDIEAIAEGEQETLELWRCLTPGCRNRFESADAHCFDCDYVDDERDRKLSVLESLRGCQSKEEWVRWYVRHFPDTHPMMILGDYNGEAQLSKAWGPFSLDEMQALVTATKG